VSKKPKRLCKLCRRRPAAVPDRERLRPFAEVCTECHAERLRGDVKAILPHWEGRSR
jgi:hypothetical protein